MGSKKKLLFNIIFLIAVFGLTVYGVFHGEDLSQVWSAVQEARWRYLAAGVICVVIFIWGESVILHYMLGTLEIRVKRRICFLFSSVGFFFSCITPSASGGQPMQIVYMRKEEIPVPVATVVLMIVTITYKLVLVAVGLYLVFFGRSFINRYLTDIVPIFHLGLVLNIGCVISMSVLAFHPMLARNIMTILYKLSSRLRLFRHTAERFKCLDSAMDKYSRTADYIRRHHMVIVTVFLITLAQRFVLFFTTYFVYRAFMLSGTPIMDVVLLQAVISVSVDMLPLPGGMGISETLFLSIFPSVFGVFLLPGMILSRGLAYYAQLLVSALATILAHLTIR